MSEKSFELSKDMQAQIAIFKKREELFRKKIDDLELDKQQRNQTTTKDYSGAEFVQLYAKYNDLLRKMNDIKNESMGICLENEQLKRDFNALKTQSVLVVPSSYSKKSTATRGTQTEQVQQEIKRPQIISIAEQPKPEKSNNFAVPSISQIKPDLRQMLCNNGSNDQRT